MRAWILTVGALGLLSATIACGGDDDGSGGNGGTTSTGGTTSMGGNGGTTSMGGNGGTTSMGGNGMGGGFGDICNDDYMDACVACTQMSCCTELEACIEDADCQELATCFLGGTPPAMCLGMVNQSDAVLNLVACASTDCGGDCT